MCAADLVAVDIKQSARDLADDLGAHYTIDPESEDVASEVEAISDGVGAAQVLDFVGADETTALAPTSVPPAATTTSSATAGTSTNLLRRSSTASSPIRVTSSVRHRTAGTGCARRPRRGHLRRPVRPRRREHRRTMLEDREIDGRAVITP